MYAAGGYYQPGKDVRALQDEMRWYLSLGYSTVKIKIGGAPLADDLRRVEAVIDVLGGDGSRSTQTGVSTSKRLSRMRTRSHRTVCAGTKRPATRSTTTCRRASESGTRTRWRPARTCSRCRTHAI